MANFCKKCGTPLHEGDAFCGKCGQIVVDAQDEVQETNETSENVPLVKEEKKPAKTTKKSSKQKQSKEWAYRMDLLKDGTVFKSVLVVFGISAGFVGLILFFATLGEGIGEALRVGGMVFGITGGIFIVLIPFSYYLVYVPMSGRYYNVIFKITDKKAKFISGPKESKRAIKIGAVAFVAGLATKNFSLAGQGLLATRTTMTTSLAGVTKVVYKESIHRITLVENRLLTNFIYVPEDEWDFMINHLKEKCTKAKFKWK